MALPTLRPHYVSRRSKPQVERLMVRRRDHEADLKQKWEETSRYFANSDLRSYKQEAWTSDLSFMDSMAAYQAQWKEDRKGQKLKERRDKLASLLADERSQFEEELRNTAVWKYQHMKQRADELKTHRIQRDKKLAEEKLHEHWKTNCPDLREVESRQMQQAVQEEWQEQIKRRDEEVKSARKEKERYDLAMEEERLAALKLEDDHKERRKMMEQDYARSLQEQMEEIRAKEEEAAALEEEEASLFREQLELERAEEERRQLEEAQRKTDFRRHLLRQHKAHLRRKSKQVQEALELDMKILESLMAQEQEDLSMVTAQRERARADVSWMKKVVAEQMELEKKRERDLELLYQEEAARMWRKREEEWESESAARDRLMAEVLAERQQQIDMKMEAVKEKQAESIQRREELLKEMEHLKRESSREIRAREREKARRQEELARQVEEKRRQVRKGKEIGAIELERQRQSEEDYDDYLEEQKDKMVTRPFTPKFYGRRKHAWY